MQIYDYMHRKWGAITKSQGFTLLELLIVTAVIAILVIIVLPEYSLFLMRGNNASALSDLKNFRAAMEAFFADNGTYPALLY